jgi:hypothetical protein
MAYIHPNPTSSFNALKACKAQATHLLLYVKSKGYRNESKPLEQEAGN